MNMNVAGTHFDTQARVELVWRCSLQICCAWQQQNKWPLLFVLCERNAAWRVNDWHRYDKCFSISERSNHDAEWTVIYERGEPYWIFWTGSSINEVQKLHYTTFQLASAAYQPWLLNWTTFVQAHQKQPLCVKCIIMYSFFFLFLLF